MTSGIPERLPAGPGGPGGPDEGEIPPGVA
jgi:hypothetical protein